MKQSPNIFGFTQDKLQQAFAGIDLPTYTAAQVCDWMYKKMVTDFGKMSNISQKNREILQNHFIIQPAIPVSSSVSSDGTVKYLFRTQDEQYVETVFIPDNERGTVCISTQSGCPLACKFCRTGSMGAGSNLTAGDILSQMLFLPEYASLTNVVIMGMGEPLLNWDNVSIALELITSAKYVGMSKKRITLSTVGIIPQLKSFLQKFPCELAISLHSPFHEERLSLMPVERKYPIAEVLQMIKRYTTGSARTISIEYIVFKGINHTEAHVNELAKILQGIPCKINLLSFHPVEGCNLQSPDRALIEDFQNKLKAKGFTVTIRKSRGKDINAACGMLAWKKNNSL